MISFKGNKKLNVNKRRKNISNRQDRSQTVSQTPASRSTKQKQPIQKYGINSSTSWYRFYSIKHIKLNKMQLMADFDMVCLNYLLLLLNVDLKMCSLSHPSALLLTMLLTLNHSTSHPSSIIHPQQPFQFNITFILCIHSSSRNRLLSLHDNNIQFNFWWNWK